jgi:hypothetical protein
MYQLPRPDEQHHRPERRGVVHTADPAHCVGPRRCTSSCLAFTASRDAVESRLASASDRTPAERPVHGDPGRGRCGPAYPPPNRINANRPLRGDRTASPGRRVTASGRALIVTATGRRRPTGSHHADGCPREGVRASELHVVTVGCLPGDAAPSGARRAVPARGARPRGPSPYEVAAQAAGREEQPDDDRRSR